MADEAKTTEAAAIYAATLLLLRAGSICRLEVGTGEHELDVTVGLHAGWREGEFVVMGNEGKTELALATCDSALARGLAAALMAYADWCDEDAAAFLAAKEAANAG